MANKNLGKESTGFKVSKECISTKSSTKADISLSLEKPKRAKGIMPGPLGKIRSMVADGKLSEMVENQTPGEEYTLEEIAQYCGVTRESVRLWEASAIKSFRRRFEKIINEYKNGHWE